MSDSCISLSLKMDYVSLYVRRRFQRYQRVQYHLLNDGSDDEDRIFIRTSLTKRKESPDPITPDDSVSRLGQNRSSPVESLQLNEFPVWGSSGYPSGLLHPYLAVDYRMSCYEHILSCLRFQGTCSHGKGPRDQQKIEKFNAKHVTFKLLVLRGEHRLPTWRFILLTMGDFSTVPGIVVA